MKRDEIVRAGESASAAHVTNKDGPFLRQDQVPVLLHNPGGGIKFHLYPKPHLVVPHAQHGVLYSGYPPRWRCQREVEPPRRLRSRLLFSGPFWQSRALSEHRRHDLGIGD